ncbi:biotin--[acetyl-CoA-carboxylase] ligase [Alphaproteobacteria bacterium HT1-32]|nr:biotin--[acetyl-CoA-carboxylase] ligase [Alphaproteobacteria bacterium HT1-32]
MTRETDLPPGFRLIILDETESTSDEVKRHARDGAEEGLVIMARSQTSGRGRRGRQWSSPPGNLYFSLLLRPECPVTEASQLSFVAAVALLEASAALLPPHSQLDLKWPNDLLLFDAKVAGLLLEAEGSGAEHPDFVVLGIGVNLVSHPEDTPYPTTDFAASAAAGITPEDMLQSFCRYFLRQVSLWVDEGFEPVRRNWLTHARGKGNDITVRVGNKQITGEFVDLDRDGALLLMTPDGDRQRITAGDVFFGSENTDAAGH